MDCNQMFKMLKNDCQLAILGDDHQKSHIFWSNCVVFYSYSYRICNKRYDLICMWITKYFLIQMNMPKLDMEIDIGLQMDSYKRIAHRCCSLTQFQQLAYFCKF